MAAFVDGQNLFYAAKNAFGHSYPKQEKGVDVRIALDSVRLARRGDVDVVLIFSQDQDLAEVAEEIRAISREERRWIKIASAYPVGPGTRNKRGIDRTDWIRIDEAAYATCLDPLDYRGGQVRRR